MAKAVKLFGGPWHGKEIAIPDEWNCVHLAETPVIGQQMFMEPSDTIEHIPIREGHYSSAHNSSTEFEWDGWKDKL